MSRVPRAAFLASAIIFFAAPGHADAWFHGVPLGLWPLVVLAFAGFACWASASDREPRQLTRAAAALLVLAALKTAAGVTPPATGWLGRYYANANFAGDPWRSTEFARLAGATRIDPAIDFRDDYLPLYFLNEADFNRGMRREVTEPVTVAWTGHLRTASETPLHLTVEVRGTASLVVDGRTVLGATTGHPSAADLNVSAGDHVVDVRYSKPPNTDPLVRIGGVGRVTPWSAAPWRLAASAPARTVARILDLGALAVFAWVLWTLAPTVAWSPARAGAAAMLVLFVAQGLAASMPLQHRAVSLSGGDDWTAYEAQARAVATGDLLMLFGQPPGHGDVLYYYPGYT
jgi:hypothetical protein